MSELQPSVGLTRIAARRTDGRLVLRINGVAGTRLRAIELRLLAADGTELAAVTPTLGTAEGWGGVLLASRPFRARLTATPMAPGTPLYLVPSRGGTGFRPAGDRRPAHERPHGFEPPRRDEAVPIVSEIDARLAPGRDPAEPDVVGPVRNPRSPSRVALADNGLALGARARRGDPAAFDDLIRPRMDRLLRLAISITGSEADGRDVVQEACVRVLRELPRPAIRCGSMPGCRGSS